MSSARQDFDNVEEDVKELLESCSKPLTNEELDELNRLHMMEESMKDEDRPNRRK